ncbi:MAG: GAF domain-containing sensor histidine kinase [Thermacetogeniaceae bacterium]
MLHKEGTGASADLKAGEALLPDKYVELAELSEKILQLEILNQIAGSIRVNMSFDEIMCDVGRKLRRLIDYDLLNLCLLEDGDLIVKTALPEDAPVLGKGTVLDRSRSWSWQVVRRGQLSIKSDIQADGGVYAAGLLEYGIRSFIIVPLRSRKSVLGTLNLGSRLKNAYSAKDGQYLQQVADHLGLIIENAKLYQEEAMLREKWENSYKVVTALLEEMEYANSQLEAINQISKEISVGMPLREILEKTKRILRKMLSFDYLSINLIEKGRTVERACSPGRLRASELQLGRLWSRIYRDAVKGKKVCCIQTGDKQGRSYQVLAVPLSIKGEVVALMCLARSHPQRFTQEDISFLQKVGDQLALCLENVRLYREEEKAKAEWLATFNATTDILLVVDRRCRLVRFNKPFDTPWKRRLEVGERFCFREQESCKVCQIRDVFLKGRSNEWRLHTSDGLVFEFAAHPIFDERRKVREVVCVVHDVTERVALEAQIVQSAKLAAIGELAAGVAHELNSPLTAIIGNALILLQSWPDLTPERARQLMEGIRSCGERCKSIIQNLCTFARQEEYNFESIEIQDVIDAALDLVAHQIESSRVRIIKESCEPGLRALGSKQQLEQVLINLLLNARDAVEGKNERVIRIYTGRRDRYVFIAVRDSGCGIKDEDREKIFMPFYTTKRKGTGLGLCISRMIAERHGGRLEVESELGKGSTFYLLLPAEKPSDAC